MSNQDSRLSALHDGELEDHEIRAAVRAAWGDESQRADWQLYALIGDSLRGGPALAADMTDQVMANVREEPVVLAPRNLGFPRKQHPLMALAASVAGVAVVGWLALAGSGPASRGEFRQVAAVPAPISVVSVTQPSLGSGETSRLPGDMNDYLLAHQAQMPSVRLGDSTRQVRTVGMVVDSRRP